MRNTELPIEDVNEKAEQFDINCAIDDIVKLTGLTRAEVENLLWQAK